MGQRANLVIVGPRGYELYYSHWCANTLPQDLFWGPEHGERFVRMQRLVNDEEGWLDTVWAEGGAVIDQPRKTLLLYGGEDILFEVPLRRLYLKLLQAVWQGWSIQWAYEGIVDIAEYVGVPRSTVVAQTSSSRDTQLSLIPPRERDWLECVGSFQFNDGLRLYPLAGMPESYVKAGVGLLGACDTVASVASLDLSEWSSSFPKGGFHVDASRKTLDFWIASECPNLLKVAQERWPGWSVTWHKDRFESQVSLTNRTLKMNEPLHSHLAQRVTAILDVEPKPVDIMEVARLMAEQDGRKIDINEISPFALRDDRLSVPAETRRSILRSAFDAVETNE